MEIEKGKIRRKESLWEWENVRVYDWEVNGEYVGWERKKMKLVGWEMRGEEGVW